MKKLSFLPLIMAGMVYAQSGLIKDHQERMNEEELDIAIIKSQYMIDKTIVKADHTIEKGNKILQRIVKIQNNPHYKECLIISQGLEDEKAMLKRAEKYLQDHKISNEEFKSFKNKTELQIGFFKKSLVEKKCEGVYND